MSVSVHAQGIKTVHAGPSQGKKNGKILSTQLLDAPLFKCLLSSIALYKDVEVHYVTTTLVKRTVLFVNRNFEYLPR